MKKCTTHQLKLASRYFDAVKEGLKTFEIRFNDRGYQKGDWLILREWDGFCYTGRECVRQVTYLCNLDAIGWEGWVAMSIE